MLSTGDESSGRKKRAAIYAREYQTENYQMIRSDCKMIYDTPI
jgi:hypothetical protein